MILYAATTNPGKLAEFADCARGNDIEVLALPHLATLPEPVEDAATFMGNAELKAIAYSLVSPDMLVFADDSGLEVDALGGDPGVRSARFADDQRFDLDTGATKDERNNACLLSQLAQLPDAPRTSRFICALALAYEGNILLTATGTVEGDILTEPRGRLGFGYDPLFLVPKLNLTLAELPPDWKWKVGHRGNAFRELLLKIEDLA
jgi:XTP/dITP diphosphohydrolase